MNPDAVERYFAPCQIETRVSDREFDDDHDGRVDEDGPEDLNDDLYNEIEQKYEAFMEMNEEILKQENADEEGYHIAGIAVHLRDGNVSYADIDPKLVGRVMGAITPEEFAIIVDAIVTAVENPQDRSYCQRQRDKDAE